MLSVKTKSLSHQFLKIWKPYHRLPSFDQRFVTSDNCTNSVEENRNETESDTQHNINLLYKRINSLKHPIYPTYRLIYPLVCI